MAIVVYCVTAWNRYWIIWDAFKVIKF